MSSTNKRLWLVSLIFIYIAIAIGGFLVAYMLRTYFLPHSTAPDIKVSQVTPAKTPTGWKKYTNTDMHFAFSYPATDTLKTSSYGFGVTNVLLEDASGTTDFQILLLPKSLAQAVGQDFDSYYAMQDNTTKIIKSPMSQDNTTEKFTKIRDRSIAGLQALDYQSIASNAPSGTQPEIGTLLSSGDNVILISTNQNNKTVLEQLLSSFTYSQ
jgi:hypothetical protein